MNPWSWFKGIIVRPMSVAADVFVSLAVGIVAFMFFGLFVGAIPLGLGGALQAAGAGILSSMFYMRARTNLLDPTPAFKV